jgi:LuxR family transcriptional regulator, maltose regulon positive regulatory protein
MLHAALEIANNADAHHARMVIQLSLAEAVTPLGDSQRVSAIIGAAESLARDSDNPMAMFIGLLGRAWNALHNDSEAQCVPLLSKALAHGREHEYHIYPGWLAPKMSELCGVAIRHGIESEYTARLIRLRNLPPDASCAFRLEWPFPVKIRTLGPFSIVLNNEPLRFSGKAPKKPLELLRGLIAFGGRRVSESMIATALWPHGGDPMQALATTLHRLRRLIGEESIERQNGYLSLIRPASGSICGPSRPGSSALRAPATQTTLRLLGHWSSTYQVFIRASFWQARPRRLGAEGRAKE